MTYNEIKAIYKKKHNSCAETCWIADVKRKLGMPVRIAYNRKSSQPLKPCPNDKFDRIAEIIRTGV